MPSLDEKLAQLVDRSEITDQLYRWARGTARNEWNLVRSVFHAHAQDDHGSFNATAAEFIEWQREYHQGIDQTAFFISNVLIEFMSVEAAFVESYVISFNHYPPEGLDARTKTVGDSKALQTDEMTSVMVGRYLDHFTKIDDVWRIEYRKVAFETVSTAPQGRNLLPHWIAAQRGRADPLYDVRARFGLGPLDDFPAARPNTRNGSN